MPSGSDLRSVSADGQRAARVERSLAPVPSRGGRGGWKARSPQPSCYHLSNIAQADATSDLHAQGAGSGFDRAWTTGSAPAKIAFFCSARCRARNFKGRSRAISICVATGSNPRAATARWSSPS